MALTFGVLAAMLLAYKARLIQATQRFRAIVIGGTRRIALLYVVTMVLSLFHVATPFMYDSRAAEHRPVAGGRAVSRRSTWCSIST